MLPDEAAHGLRIWNADDQPDRSILALRQNVALELSRAELGLEIDEPALHLNRDHLIEQSHDKVVRPSAAITDRNLEPAVPPRRRLAHDRFSHLELARVSQRDRCLREEPDRELVPTGGRKAAGGIEARRADPALDGADVFLGEAGTPCRRLLGEPNGHPSKPQLARETGKDHAQALAPDIRRARPESAHARIVISAAYQPMLRDLYPGQRPTRTRRTRTAGSAKPPDRRLWQRLTNPQFCMGVPGAASVTK
jgi:hypothetical protein